MTYRPFNVNEPEVVYVLDAWCADEEVSTTEVYNAKEKARLAQRRYFDRHADCMCYAGIVKRKVR